MDYRTIPAFCINLDRRPDRWEQVQPRFAALDWPVTRFSAVSYAEPTVYGIDGCHAGALDSHRAIWRLCLDRAYSHVAIFEDDVVFPRDFRFVFPRAAAQLPRDWSLWLFHSSHAKFSTVSKYIVRIRSTVWGAHGYLVTRKGCEKLLSITAHDHIDTVMSKHYARLGAPVYGMPQPFALAFQQGNDDSNIPVTCQAKFWREQREQYWR